MKVAKAKELVQQLIYAEKWSKQDIIDSFSEIANASQQHHKKTISLYRVIKLEDARNIKPEGISSTSTHFHSVVDIADQMPSIIMGKSKTISLNSIYMRFEVSPDRILLDIKNIALPLIKEKLKNVMNHRVEDKWGEEITIEKAICLYEDSDENEIIADLSSLPYEKVICPNHCGGRISQNNIANITQNKMSHLSNNENPYHSLTYFKNVLSKKDYLKALKDLKAHKAIIPAQIEPTENNVSLDLSKASIMESVPAF